MTDFTIIARSLLSKCNECGIDPEIFIQEKLLELEERKRILLTPTAEWFKDNFSKYNEFASNILRRPITDEEKYSANKLTEFIKRRLSPQQPLVADEMLKRKLLEEANGRCSICGKLLTIETIRIDHKIPLSEGGSSHPLNLQALCELCNNGKSDYFQETAQAAARPWYEKRKSLLSGTVALSPKKRFCAITRDASSCRLCGAKSCEAELMVVLRVPQKQGGQAVYDNLMTVCERCLR